MQDNRNFILAIALTMAIMLGYQFLYLEPLQQEEQERQAALEAAQPQESADLPDMQTSGDLPDLSVSGNVPGSSAPAASREEVLGSRQSVTINTPHLKGSIPLKGARFDDLTLSDYKDSLEESSDNVTLLSPTGTENSYYADFGWIGEGKRPDAKSVWQADREEISTNGTVNLTWDNGEGLRFTRTVSLDESYMFTVTQRIENTGTEAVTVAPYGRIFRKGRPETQALYILHEGPLWVMDEGKEEYTYDDLEDEDKLKSESSTGGWVGITDKYWLVALVPDQKQKFKAEMFRKETLTGEQFHANFTMNGQVLQPGGTIEQTSRLFAGAKKVDLLDDYTDRLGIKLFNYAIDWGMFDFLTKPIFKLLDFFFGLVGNFGIAILLLTAVMKLVLFPLANKQYKSMNKMKALQPKIQALKERFGDDKMKMQQAQMELFKKEKVNPASGCLPIFIQFPVFFALYKVLYVTIDMRHAPFFGWVTDLSSPDTMLVTNLFGLIPWEPTGFLAIGILPILMGFTMWLQMQMAPTGGDPMQRKIMMFMPIIFTFMMAQFSVGLVIYWTFSNVWGIAQQWYLMRRADIPVIKEKA